MHRPSSPASAVQRGASTAEFIVVAPVLLFLGFGAVQLGLIYHGRTILNYATFEAARTGAVNHALPEPMRRELAERLAPILGGDGSAAKAAEAIARSIVDLESPLGPDGMPRPATTVTRLSPTPAAFADWGVHDPVAGRTVIPNSHLRHRHAVEAPGESGVSLRDANVLEIEVTHGFELKVPVVGRVLTTALAMADPENAAWYAADRLPLSSVATVRMQSDAWLADDEPLASVVPEGAAETGSGSGSVAVEGDGAAGEEGDDAVDGAGGEERAESTAGDEVCGEHGVGGAVLPLSESAYLGGSCAAGDESRAPPEGPAIFGPEGDASPIPPGASGC